MGTLNGPPHIVVKYIFAVNLCFTRPNTRLKCRKGRRTLWNHFLTPNQGHENGLIGDFNARERIQRKTLKPLREVGFYHRGLIFCEKPIHTNSNGNPPGKLESKNILQIWIGLLYNLRLGGVLCTISDGAVYSVPPLPPPWAVQSCVQRSVRGRALSDSDQMLSAPSPDHRN